MELKKYFSQFLAARKKKLSDRDCFLETEMYRILGCHIQNIALYREAFALKNSCRDREIKNYERLEFLGDSVLGTIIASHLFTMYPQENEGFLTQMKSKIVNRKNLNKLGETLGLVNILETHHGASLSENISGNLFESLVGALYLDAGYELCHKIVLERLLTPVEINRLEHKIVSYKGLLMEWSQKKKVVIRYETCQETQPNKKVVFRSHVFLGSEKISNASETSKKKAEEKAAQRAFYILNKKKSILEISKDIA